MDKLVFRKASITKTIKMEISKRTAAFTELIKFCPFAKEHDHVEVTNWINGEGYTITISSTRNTSIDLTRGEFEAIRKTIKFLDKHGG